MIFPEPKLPHNGGPLALLFEYFKKWIKSERVFIKGWQFSQSTEGKTYFPPDSLPGGGGINWQTPKKELDPSKAVAVNTLVYISPASSLVTAGIKDLVTGTVIQAMPGVWLSVKAVPAQVTIAGVNRYNMPQALAQGATAGSPLAGDADNANVFWIPIAGVMRCG